MDKRKKANKYLERIKNGDKGAFDDLFRMFYGYVHDMAFMVLVDKTHVDDVVESTFEAVLQSIHGFDGEKSGYAWIMAIAKNLALKTNRTEHKYDLCESSEDFINSLHADKFEYDGEGNYNVVQALKILDPIDRKIVVLKVYSDKTIADISRLLDLDYMEVYNRFKKSLKILEKFYKKR